MTKIYCQRRKAKDRDFFPGSFRYWNANGGGPDTSTTSQTYGEKLTLPTAPTKEGDSFAGWYTAYTDGNPVTDSTTYSTAGNTACYAHWTTSSYYRYNGNPNSGR